MLEIASQPVTHAAPRWIGTEALHSLSMFCVLLRLLLVYQTSFHNVVTGNRETRTSLLPSCPSSAYKSGERVIDILLLSSFLISLPKSGSCGNSSTGQLVPVLGTKYKDFNSWRWMYTERNWSATDRWITRPSRERSEVETGQKLLWPALS